MTFIISSYNGDMYPIGPMDTKTLHATYDRIHAMKSTANHINHLKEQMAFYDKTNPDKIEHALTKFGRLIRTIWLPHNYSPLCKYVALIDSNDSSKV